MTLTVGRHSYTREEVERGLIALAYANGNSRHAARMLKDTGMHIEHTVLWRWKNENHADLYKELQERVLPDIRAAAAEKHMAQAEREIEVSREALERLAGKLDELPARDLPGAVRNLDTGAAIHRDKAAMLRGEATVITGKEPRDLKQVIRALKSKGVDFVDAEVVEETAVLPAGDRPSP